jgi:hypothetical protein
MRKLLALLVLVGLLAVPVSADAGIIANLQDWQIDLSAASLGAEAMAAGTVVTGIEQILFSGWNHVTLHDVGDQNGVIEVGDHARVRGLLIASDLTSDGPPPVDDKGLIGDGIVVTPGWDLTFAFDVEIVYTGATVSGFDFTHLAKGTGLTAAVGNLDWYIDTTANGITNALSGGPAAAFIDGVLVASMEVQNGDGGSINLSTLDGSDDATFFDTTVSSFAAGVFLKNDGTDFGLLPPSQLIFAITDSNFDMDPTGGGFGVIPSLPTGFGAPTPNTLANFNATEDGSSRLGIIPEPATWLIWSVLLGFAGFYRLRRRGQ